MAEKRKWGRRVRKRGLNNRKESRGSKVMRSGRRQWLLKKEETTG
jgi:hypothetical protein